MATFPQQVPEKPDCASPILRDVASASRKLGNFLYEESSSVHPAVKRRRLNYPAHATGSQTSASRWFENVNRNVEWNTHSNSDFDRDPPFYLYRQLSAHTPAQMTAAQSFAAPQVQVPTVDSENQDLRSVIDDLTIENKRLRQLFRERQQQHSSSLDRDKIFEIRTRCLSPEKKRELEIILHKFASSISEISLEAPPLATGGSSANARLPAVAEGSIQHRSLYPHTDSAYASVSNSGMASVENKNTGTLETHQMYANKDNNIKSYLHDIPDSLLPKHSPIMSENAKMRLVVKRLEQLFTGKTAVPREHSQPLQQQRVSESAATADRHTSLSVSRYIRPEGAREAPILPFGSKFDLEPPMVERWYRQPLDTKSESDHSSRGSSGVDNRSPEQRPTRPLDLDIHRAQMAEENIEYLRHLGLPTPRRGQDLNHPKDDWVYLNLLINMAQLHTVNVTPAFVQKAIAHLSTKFELNKDGRKIRWKGGSRDTQSSDEFDSEGDATTVCSSWSIQEPSRTNSARDYIDFENIASTGTSNALASRPLKCLSSGGDALMDSSCSRMHQLQSTQTSTTRWCFGHKPSLLKENALLPHNSFHQGSDKPRLAQGLEDLTGQYSNNPANETKNFLPEQPEDDGPIIYYKNHFFYCDMSSDNSQHQRSIMSVPTLSTPVLGAPVGCDVSAERRTHASFSTVGASDEAACESDLPTLALNPLLENIDYQTGAVNLPASGIGGVLPDDHFVLSVRRKHQRMGERRFRPAAHFWSGSKRRCIIKEEILSVARVDLPPSKLPPPSMMLLSLSSETSSGVEGDDYFSDESEESEEESLDEVDSVLRPPLRRFPTDSSGQRWATDEAYNDLQPHPSIHVGDQPRTADSGPDLDQVDDLNHTYTLDRRAGIVTGSLAATAGAGSAASLASNRSVVSSSG